jgi:hypothetical protein
MSSKKKQLSKSSFIRSIQCPKSLYLYKNFYDLRDKPDTKRQQKFDRGLRVGKLAWQLFPNGKDCTPPHPTQYQQSIAATQLLTAQKFPVIYEAAFKYQGILVALDILECKDGVFNAYEVKSSVSVSQTYLFDCAIQYYIIEKSGIRLQDFFIVYINNDYRRNGFLDVQALFKKKSVLKEVKALQPFIQEKIDAAIKIIEEPQMPNIHVGAQCSKPYPCDFQSYCWKDIPQNSIWNLQGASTKNKIEAAGKGITTIEAYAAAHQNDIKLKSYLSNTEVVNKKGLSDFFNKIQYPVCFFDVEASQNAIPVFENTKPYEKIPFLYSLHIKNSADEPCIHKDFFAETDADHRKELLLHFLEDTENVKTILVYNDLMEKMALNYLADLFPEYKTEITERIHKMLDMELPFKHLYYYHPNQLGSFSLKTIAACMLQNNPYTHIDIKDGEEAMAIYSELFYKTENEQQYYYKKLREYCRADTYVLTEIWDKLMGMA